ncbi:hypothetical protein T459_18496 [Capsicum annuum]|uniref:Uncharacterized protein n=1 Tax=Capsicum annuum TaxID=4072 RepID=A0A2G2ZES1_CAPAN|nr:hypothetical protein T459_18496 [Capsicum annuum]
MAEFTMEGEMVALLFVAFLCSTNAYEVMVSCMMAYDEGGASAVLSSPECPRWDFSAAIKNGTDDCLVATHQGRRKYQEDRIRCYPHVTVPVLAMYRSQATMVAPIWNPSCFEDSKRGQAITRELKTLQTKSKCGGRYAAEDIKTNSAV